MKMNAPMITSAFVYIPRKRSVYLILNNGWFCNGFPIFGYPKFYYKKFVNVFVARWFNFRYFYRFIKKTTEKITLITSY
jgi:hypothetical protein